MERTDQCATLGPHRHGNQPGAQTFRRTRNDQVRADSAKTGWHGRNDRQRAVASRLLDQAGCRCGRAPSAARRIVGRDVVELEDPDVVDDALGGKGRAGIRQAGPVATDAGVTLK